MSIKKNTYRIHSVVHNSPLNIHRCPFVCIFLHSDISLHIFLKINNINYFLNSNVYNFLKVQIGYCQYNVEETVWRSLLASLQFWLPDYGVSFTFNLNLILSQCCCSCQQVMFRALLIKVPPVPFGLRYMSRSSPQVEIMIRVDHAGELGADRIYAGQMAVLGMQFWLFYLCTL